MVDIENCQPGDILWFVKWAQTDIRGADEREINEGLVFCGTIKSVEMTAYEKMWEPHPDRKQFSVVFEEHLPNPDGSPIYGMTFWVGNDTWRNPTCFLTREEAESQILDQRRCDLENAEEALRRARVEFEYCQTRSDIQEIDWEAANEGFRLSTIMMKQAEIDARG